MTESPKVIFNSIFTFALNKPDGKYKNHNKSIKRVQKMYDYYTNEEKWAMFMYDYYTGKLTKENTMNLIKEDGTFAASKEAKKRKKLAVKYLENSNLWQGVLSFNNDYINENIDIHKLEKYKSLLNELLKDYKCDFVSEEDYDDFKQKYLYEINKLNIEKENLKINKIMWYNI